MNQQTTKKNSLNKANSCVKIGQNSSCKTSKSNLIKLEANRNSRVVSSLVRQSNYSNNNNAVTG